MKRVLFSILGVIFTLTITAAAPPYNYGEVLQKSIFFYEAQQSGVLPNWNRVSWRGNSGLNDGKDNNIDLTGGWYDAGDHVKFNFPMAFSTTALAWGAIEFEKGYKNSGQYDILLQNLRFVTDYFIKCHPSPNVLYGQVGNGSADHAWWGSAEVMKMDRPSYKIDATKPGSDLAGETAAAMAATSILFKTIDPTYSALLIKHAKELFTFAKTYKGKYSASITDATAYYNSWSGYEDELTWAAIWLYKATQEASYLTEAKAFYENLGLENQSTERKYKWGMAWDDKSYGCYILMAQLTGETKYKTDVERHLDYWTDGYNGQKITYSPGGLAVLDVWGPLRYAANTAFIAFLYSDIAPAAKKQKYYDFAVRQINYCLGDNPDKRSYVCGFGTNPPVNPHHRTVHGTWMNDLTKEPITSRHTLYGALVGGPDKADKYTDDRGNYFTNEVACDYNACFTGVVAKMVQDFGGSPLSNFPIKEVPKDEFYCDVKNNATGDRFSELAIYVRNHSAWPARTTDKLSFRYYLDITEGVNAGLKPTDYEIRLNNADGAVASALMECDKAKNIYFVEVDLKGIEIWPGGDSPSRKEVQVRIGLPTTASASSWNPLNDFSYKGVGSSLTKNDNVPIYDDGVYLAGVEHEGCPIGTVKPRAKFTVTPTIGMNPLTVEVNASESTGPDGLTLAYDWNFGDGTTAKGIKTSHIYATPGNYTITLTVSTGADSNIKTAEITVKDKNSPPQADFTASPLSGAAPLKVDFDASTSFIANGEALTYSWTFGDGNTGTGKITSHTYTTPGKYDVELTVKHATLGSSKSIKSINAYDPTLMGDLKLQFKNSASSSTAISPHFKIINNGTDAVNLDELTIRYWYKSNSTSGMACDIDYATVGNANVSGTFTNLTTPAKGANQYLSLAFKPAAGKINAKGNSGDIQARIHLTSYANAFTPSADHSYLATSNEYVEWENVTLYRNGSLIYGIEPKSESPTTNVNETIISKIKVYPNPVEGAVVYVKIPNDMSSIVTIHNLAGAIIFQTQGINEVEIPTNTLGSGVYLVNVQNGTLSKNIKLVVK